MVIDTAAITKELKRRIRFFAEDKIKKAKLIVVGSERRGEIDVNDLDYLLVTKHDVGDVFLCDAKRGDLLNINHIIMKGSRHKMIEVSYGRMNIVVDLFITEPDKLPFALFHYTGSKKYNIRIRKYAKDKGLLLNQYGIFDRITCASVANNIHTERDIANFLGITYRLPANRI